MAQDPSEEEDKKEPSLEQQLVAAIRKKDLDKCRTLVLEFPKLNQLGEYSLKTKEKLTPLHIAVSKRNLAIVKLLLQFKADPNIQSFPAGTAPIHIASQWADVEILQALIDAGADATIKNNKGKNCLNLLGNKYKSDNFDPDLIDKKTEAQLLLLSNATGKAEKNAQEIDNDIADAVSGLKGLKIESNIRIKNAQKAQGKRFDQTHPYLKTNKQRLSVWQKKNGTIRDFLKKRQIAVHVPTWTDSKDVVHVDLSRVQQFQVTVAVQLLEQNGLKLEPEPKSDNQDPSAKPKKKKKKPKPATGDASSTSSTGGAKKGKKKGKK